MIKWRLKKKTRTKLKTLNALMRVSLWGKDLEAKWIGLASLIYGTPQHNWIEHKLKLIMTHFHEILSNASFFNKNISFCYLKFYNPHLFSACAQFFKGVFFNSSTNMKSKRIWTFHMKRRPTLQNTTLH